MIGFDNFFAHKDPHVRKVAGLLADAEQELKAGRLTHDEFQELASDMIDMVNIDQHASTLEMRTKIRMALEQLKEIAAGVSL